jgi:hypothetical protein
MCNLTGARLVTLLLSCTAISGPASSQSPSDAFAELVSSGRFEVLANTLLTEAPTIMFAKGAVAQAQAQCGFLPTPLSNEAINFNYGHYIQNYHLAYYDENGLPTVAASGNEVLERAARFQEQFAFYATYMSDGEQYVQQELRRVGCDAPAFVAFVENADAIVALGLPPNVIGEEPSSTLIRMQYSPGDTFAQCHYADPAGGRLTIRQDHFVLDFVNQEMMSNPFRVREISIALKEMPFMRSSCARNPDPDRLVRPGELVEDPATSFEAGTQTHAQQMASYFLTVIIPRDVSPSELPDKSKSEDLLAEIEKFEGIQIAAMEVTARAREFAAKDLGLTMETYCLFGDTGARRQAFRDQFGRAVRLDHLPHPLQEPDYKNVLVSGAAYLGAAGKGRSEILSQLGRSWHWDGQACVQGAGLK